MSSSSSYTVPTSYQTITAAANIKAYPSAATGCNGNGVNVVHQTITGATSGEFYFIEFWVKRDLAMTTTTYIKSGGDGSSWNQGVDCWALGVPKTVSQNCVASGNFGTEGSSNPADDPLITWYGYGGLYDWCRVQYKVHPGAGDPTNSAFPGGTVDVCLGFWDASGISSPVLTGDAFKIATQSGYEPWMNAGLGGDRDYRKGTNILSSPTDLTAGNWVRTSDGGGYHLTIS